MSNTVRGRFTVCVDTYQAVPVLKKAEKGEKLPQFAEWLPDDNKFTKKGWYIIFCDPTLPEAGDPDLVGVSSVPALDFDISVPSEPANADDAMDELDLGDFDDLDFE